MIDKAALDSEMARLNQTLALYQRASGKALDEVLRKKSNDLRIELFKQFRTLMPAKGAVRAERLQSLRHGGGIHVRAKVYEAIAAKYGAVPIESGLMMFRAGARGGLRGTTRAGLNLQALAVQRELSLRESGRGFTAWSANKQLMPSAEATEGVSVSRYEEWLGEFRMPRTVEKDGKAEATFTWGPLSQESADVVRAIGRAKGMKAVQRAMAAVTADMIPYIEEHIGKAATAAGLGKV
jgi:hypothetical protein